MYSLCMCAITASSAAAAGAIIFFVSYLPFSFFGADSQYPSVSAQAKFSLSLVPNLAVGIGCKTLGMFESIGMIMMIMIIIIMQRLTRHVSVIMMTNRRLGYFRF